MLLDDLKVPLTKEEQERRRFLGVLGGGALAAAAVGTCIAGLSYLEPNVLFEDDPKMVVGRPDAIAPGAVLAFPKKKLYVVRKSEGIVALSAVCTHLGCMTRIDPSGAGFACPCHGSRFHLDGTVAAGPAPRPLSRLKVIEERGLIVVDTSKVLT
jgi:cytochrome b6-f complex iron-sulfur subunit